MTSRFPAVIQASAFLETNGVALSTQLVFPIPFLSIFRTWVRTFSISKDAIFCDSSLLCLVEFGWSTARESNGSRFTNNICPTVNTSRLLTIFS